MSKKISKLYHKDLHQLYITEIFMYTNYKDMCIVLDNYGGQTDKRLRANVLILSKKYNCYVSISHPMQSPKWIDKQDALIYAEKCLLERERIYSMIRKDAAEVLKNVA